MADLLKFRERLQLLASLPALELVELGDSLLHRFGKTLDLLRLVSSGAKRITNLFWRKLAEQSSDPLSIGERNVFADPAHVKPAEELTKTDEQED